MEAKAKTILVVDDERVIREMLRRTLEAEGYAVTVAADGEEALESIRGQRPDMILLDLVLPKKNGWEVCLEVRRRWASLKIPIIILTGTSLEQARQSKIGADDYLSKPFQSEELKTRVAALFQKCADEKKAEPPKP
ncbi:MAG: response regulator [Elusimicrobia bacterium]|nr:response regulator [Elusimicrobiota bacterium]